MSCLVEEGISTKGESDVNSSFQVCCRSSLKWLGVAKQSGVVVDRFFVLVNLECLTGCMISHQLVHAYLVGFFQ